MSGPQLAKDRENISTGKMAPCLCSHTEGKVST
jgi:hypothetical protein